MTGLKFHFRSGGTWMIDRRFIGDLWIKHITTSFGRIHGSKFVETHLCEGFRTEIFQEGDHVQACDTNLGDLELGIFSRTLKYKDIKRMEIPYKNGIPDLVYLPYRDKTDEDLDNIYQSTKVNEKTKNLCIVVNPAQTINDVCTEELK